MAGTIQTDFLQPQSGAGLTILTPSGNTIATVNTSGIYSSTGNLMVSYTGNIAAPSATITTVAATSVSANTITFADGSVQNSAGGIQANVFYEVGQVLSRSYTVTSGKSALTAGPITIPAGMNITIPANSRIVIV